MKGTIDGICFDRLEIACGDMCFTILIDGQARMASMQEFIILSTFMSSPVAAEFIHPATCTPRWDEEFSDFIHQYSEFVQIALFIQS
jgi:hypothetical protein